MQPDGDTTASRGGQESKPQGSSVIRSAAFMSLGTLVSRILGLVRDTVLAATFPRIITDAYVVAFRLPNLFRRILGEGSLAASFVPLYVDSIQNKSGDNDHAEALRRGQNLANAVYSVLSLVTATLAVLGILFMEPLMNHLVGGQGYQGVAGKVDLTIEMAKIMFGFLYLIMMYAFLMSILNSHKKFFLPALAPAALNFFIIIFCLFPPFKFEGDQLAWGVIAGGIAQLLMVVIPLVKMGHMPKLTMAIWGPGVAKFFRNLIPSMLGLGILQILALFNVYFASRLPEGAHSYIYLADRLLEFPQSLLSVSLGVALLPTLSEFWARGQKQQLVETTQKHVRLLLTLSLPTAAGLYFLSDLIIDVVFRRGQFSAEDAIATADVLRIYAFVLLFAGIHRVTVPAFYAAKNTWLPAVLSAICVIVHVFVADWAVDQYSLNGLVGATAFTGFLNLFLLAICFRYFFGPLGVGALLKSALHMLPALSALVAICIHLSQPLVSTVGRYAGLGAVILLASAAFFVIGSVSRHPEIKQILSVFLRRIKR